MNTRQAEYKTEIGRLAEAMAQRDASRDAAAAQRDVDAAKRETRQLLAIAAMIAVAVAILGFLGN